MLGVDNWHSPVYDINVRIFCVPAMSCMSTQTRLRFMLSPDYLYLYDWNPPSPPLPQNGHILKNLNKNAILAADADGEEEEEEEEVVAEEAELLEIPFQLKKH